MGTKMSLEYNEYGVEECKESYPCMFNTYEGNPSHGFVLVASMAGFIE
jgi:hypothetical protein